MSDSSGGMVNVAELRKIVEVPFPFPYSQYLSFMLVLHWLVSPLVAVQLISEWSWAGGTVWLISTSYWTLLLAFYHTCFLQAGLKCCILYCLPCIH